MAKPEIFLNSSGEISFWNVHKTSCYIGKEALYSLISAIFYTSKWSNNLRQVCIFHISFST